MAYQQHSSRPGSYAMPVPLHPDAHTPFESSAYLADPRSSFIGGQPVSASHTPTPLLAASIPLPPGSPSNAPYSIRSGTPNMQQQYQYPGSPSNAPYSSRSGTPSMQQYTHPGSPNNGPYPLRAGTPNMQQQYPYPSSPSNGPYPLRASTPSNGPYPLHADTANAHMQQHGSQHAHEMPYMAPAAYTPSTGTPYLRAQKRRRRWCFAFTLLALAIIVVAVVVPIYFLVIKKDNSGSSSSGGGPNTGGGSVDGGDTAQDPTTGSQFIVGRDGDTVTTSAGAKFVYANSFNGYFVVDSKNPYNSGARAQDWSPALNETWDWNVHKIRGVNFGGWLVPEPFIVPGLYQKYMNSSTNTVQISGDEWSLSQAMAQDPQGLAAAMEDHYKTFITEEDVAQLPGAGLNFIRLPIGFWAIETWTDVEEAEPFLAHVSWKYALQAIEWCRKYGIRVNLDLHAVPGAQNPWNHSGKGGNINFLSGAMGYANAQRGLDYMRTIIEFISQPEYSNVVVMFGIVNEPDVDIPTLQNFYRHAHDVLRSVTGFGAGKGPFLSIHDRFQGPAVWFGFMSGADRVALDQHPYFAFGAGNAPEIEPFIARSCEEWGPDFMQSQTAFGVTTAGEWSLGFNDCGLYINGVRDTHVTQGCAAWDTWEEYDDTKKTQLLNFASAQMDTFAHWFFWTWKIGEDWTGHVRCPLWSYKLGLDNGWIPRDPRTAEGACQRAGSERGTAAPHSAWQTGGAGAGTFLAGQPSAVWPPASLPGLEPTSGLWPTYTAARAAVTLPPIANNPKSVTTNDNPYYATAGFGGQALSSSVDGWANNKDTAQMVTRVSGCAYPDTYEGGTTIPAACAGAAKARRTVGAEGVAAKEPIVTPPPVSAGKRTV
ncbi:glycoside hydrolase [Auriculariales sp. MPI-PUGE-AT-0066]|nr:glycoside hydrolase [Auriculariales sp. MPI-PUGE-AT-0066]